MSLVPANQGSNDGQQPSDNNNPKPPRPPTSLQDLLRYSLQVGSGPSDVPPPPLDLERKIFLDNVFKTLTVDVIKEFCDALDVLKDVESGARSVAEYEDALDKIYDLVDNIDFANDFCKVGGFQILRKCLDCNYSEVRWKAAYIIAECSQNNPTAQSATLDLGLLHFLMDMSEKDPDEICRIKAFFGVSAIVRDFEPAYELFVISDGYSLILRLMSSPVKKLKLKAAFFLSSLLSSHPEIKGFLCEMGFIEGLIPLLRNGRRLREFVLLCLTHFFEDCPNSITIASEPELGLRPLLHQLIDNPSEEFPELESVEYAKKLLIAMYDNDSENEEVH